ncbi:MAG TPA: hypothetical protein VK133_02830 [Amoebophilaceae bacterium]|nr:hypothetical protein [Amoebophilaceae bacterium]
MPLKELTEMFPMSSFTKGILVVTLYFTASAVGCIRIKPETIFFKEKASLPPGEPNKSKNTVASSAKTPRMASNSEGKSDTIPSVASVPVAAAVGSSKPKSALTQSVSPRSTIPPTDMQSAFTLGESNDRLPSPLKNDDEVNDDEVNTEKKSNNPSPEANHAVTTNEQAREAFIKAFIENEQELKKLGLNFNEYGNQVSLVVLAKTAKTAKTAKQKECILLGKILLPTVTIRGIPMQQFTFVRGCIPDQPTIDKKERLVGALYDATRKALGIHLMFDAFQKSLVQIRAAKGTEKDMMCFCFLSEINITKWDEMRTKRQASQLDNTYLEMNELKYISRDKPYTFKQDVTNRPEYSSLVTDNKDSITEAFRKINQSNKPPVSWETFPKYLDTVPMLDT